MMIVPVLCEGRLILMTAFSLTAREKAGCMVVESVNMIPKNEVIKSDQHPSPGSFNIIIPKLKFYW